MKFLRIGLAVFFVSLILGVIPFAQLASSKPSEPVTYDYAEFCYDPYPIGPNTITIYFQHDSYCNMYIFLYDYNDLIVESWLIDRYTREGFLTYSASYDGVWHLYCKMGDYYYVTDEAVDVKFSFNIDDPNSTQNNLGSDWARHPQDWNIYNQAMSILNYNTSLDAYTASYMIQSHVLQYFDHNASSDISFRNDTGLLDELEATGNYTAVCRSDAVILTAYARSVGIPARIVYLEMRLYLGAGQYWVDPHYFAEFYIPDAPGTYKWIPVDGDNWYGWFDQPEANEDISAEWPYEPPTFQWIMWDMKFIIEIPGPGIVDDIPPDCWEYYVDFEEYYTNEL